MSHCLNISSRFRLLLSIAVLLAVVIAGLVGILGSGLGLHRLLLLDEDEPVVEHLLLLLPVELAWLLLA